MQENLWIGFYICKMGTAVWFSINNWGKSLSQCFQVSTQKLANLSRLLFKLCILYKLVNMRKLGKDGHCILFSDILFLRVQFWMWEISIAFGIFQIAYNKNSNSQCNLGKIHLHKNAVKRTFCKKSTINMKGYRGEQDMHQKLTQKFSSIGFSWSEY